MNNNYRRIIMWALYGLFFVLVLLIQTVVFGDRRFDGAKLSFLPVAVVCVTVFTGHEAGGLFGLLAGLFWTFAGGQDGPVAMVTFTVCGIFAGWLCDAVYARRFIPAVLLSLGALALHQTTVFLLQRWVADAVVPWHWLPNQIFLSWPAAVVCYPLCKLIRKAGGD